jgi:hypothetical protein
MIMGVRGEDKTVSVTDHRGSHHQAFEYGYKSTVQISKHSTRDFVQFAKETDDKSFHTHIHILEATRLIR